MHGLTMAKYIWICFSVTANSGTNITIYKGVFPDKVFCTLSKNVYFCLVE